MKRFINISLLLVFCFWMVAANGQKRSVDLENQNIDTFEETSTKEVKQQYSKRWMFGPKVGVGLSNFFKDENRLGDWTTAYQAGGFVSYRPVKLISLNMDLLYASIAVSNLDKNQFTEPAYSTFQIEEVKEVRTQQVVVPLYVGLHIPIFKRLETAVLLGGSVGYNFNTTSDLRISHTVGEQELFMNVEKDVTSQYEYLNLSAISGVRLGIKGHKRSYFLDLTYSYGLSDIDNQSQELNQRIQGLSLSFGIEF